MEQIILNKHALVLDVRERESYREGHFRGAYCCPYEEIDGWMRHFNRNRTLLVYCEYGSTSLLAARQPSKCGYEVYTVVGGMQAIRRYNGYD
jgi:thiosulfate sulfurtransferase glpE